MLCSSDQPIKGSMKVELYYSGPPDPNYEYIMCIPKKAHQTSQFKEMNEKEQMKYIFEMEEKRMKKVKAEMNKLALREGFEVTEENGTRRYGPPKSFKERKPEKEAEIFIGRLPRTIFEDELIPLFESVGRIYEVRVMLSDAYRYNRGFCFITYFNPKHAELAIKTFNDYEIRKGKFLGVVKSENNCRLFISGIPRDKCPEYIEAEIRKATIGVIGVAVSRPLRPDDLNRGYVFVEYETHKKASLARRHFLHGTRLLFKIQPIVEWADAFSERCKRVNRNYSQ